MMKRILSLTIVQAFVAQSVFAANLGEYRGTLLKGAFSTESMSLDRAAQLRQMLGTDGVVVHGLAEFQAQQTRHQRFYSSITFKDILQTGLTESIRSIKYDGQIPFDPAWSPQEHKQILELAEKRRFVKAMMKAKKSRHGDDGINIIVGELYSKLAVQEYKVTKEGVKNADPACVAKDAAAKKAAAVENVDAMNASIQKMTNIVATHLQNGPRNELGLGITDILGKVTKVELIDGMVHRVFFGEGERTLPVGLSFILTVRTGEDDVFVRSQELLLDYLKSQKAVFKKRQDNYNQFLYWDLIDSPYYFMNGEWNKIKAVEARIVGSATDKERAQAEVDDMYDMVKMTDDNEKFFAEMRFFSEGRDFSKNFQVEKEFIDTRLKKDELLIPYLETKVATAKIGNVAMKALTRAQQNYLLDMYLQLRGRDLPTSRDLIAMERQFPLESDRIRSGRMDAKICDSEKAQLDLLAADFMYYRVIANQLTDLQSALLEEGSLAAARKKEIDLIRSK
jgi:hypothetical protein